MAAIDFANTPIERRREYAVEKNFGKEFRGHAELWTLRTT